MVRSGPQRIEMRMTLRFKNLFIALACLALAALVFAATPVKAEILAQGTSGTCAWGIDDVGTVPSGHA